MTTDTAIDAIKDKRNIIKEFLKEAPINVEEQKHLDAGTAEQAYWHYGYMIALKDVLNLIDAKGEKQ